MRAPDFWDRSTDGMLPTLLRPLGCVVAGLAALRQKRGRPHQAGVPVICVGNLVAGGAGKTPVALDIVARLNTRGIKAHVLMRGYGGSEIGPVRVNLASHTAAQVGDEALLLADRIIPLNPGPKATLGPDFKVNLARPRERTAMHSDATFKKLRADITKYLMDVGAAAQAATGNEGELPNVTPVFPQTNKPPKAFRDAMQSHHEDRYLEFFNLTKVYPTPKGPLTVVDGFETILKKGEFISLIGHSGCGKSTVLSMAAGLNPISDGGIVLDGHEISGANPERAVVFQAPNLYTWLTAKENVMLGVERVFPHATPGERSDIVEYYLSRVGLKDAMHKPTADMSNGMKQRVGIARAFALSPKLLLLDEPFGMLDSLTRWELQEVLMEVWDRTKVTTVCVTHDVDEAILLADRVVMMTNGPHARIGKIMDVDLPRPRTRKALLEHPKYYELREQLLGFLEEYEHGHKGKSESKSDELETATKAVA